MHTRSKQGWEEVNMKSVLAIILAGGRGKRMDILCRGRAKPALPFAGRFRVIDFSLSNCVNSGIHDIAVLADYERRPMADYLGAGASWGLGQRGNFQVLEPKSGSYKGTADAIYQNLWYLDKGAAELILVLAADHVYKMDYRKMLASHERVGADVTVGVISVPIEEAHRFGIVTVNAEGRIIEFIEKPRIPASSLASMGIYVFNRGILTERLIEDAAQPSSPHDFGHAVIPKMVKQDKVFAYKFDGYWQDIGTVESYYAANMELTRQMPSFSLNGSWPVFTKENGSLAPEISELTIVKHSLISPGCVIKGEVERSVLSPGVRVEEEAVVRDSAIMANTTIGKHSVVDRCILDEEVNIGKFCYIGFGASLIPGNWDITVLGRGVTVPPYTAICRNCKILTWCGASGPHHQGRSFRHCCHKEKLGLY